MQFGRAQRAAVDLVLLAKSGELELRMDELEGRMLQLRHAGKLGL